VYSDDGLQTLLRLGTATLIGGLIGINRDLHGKPLGLRTLAIVALGSAMVALLIDTYAGSRLQTPVDAVSRVLQGILTGIGFLGAGVILRSEDGSKVHGLTTAATIWVTAGIGVACGLGIWNLAIVGAGLTLLVLTTGRAVERRIERLFKKTTDDPPPAQR